MNLENLYVKLISFEKTKRWKNLPLGALQRNKKMSG